MPRFRLATILLVMALIPIGVGFAIGANTIVMLSLLWLFPMEVSGDEVIKWGWPTNAQEFLRPYFGDSLLYPVNLTHKVGLILVAVVCTALGALRLQTAKAIAWSLTAVLPLSVAVFNYRTAGQVYILPADYVVTAFGMLLCIVGWSVARCGMRRRVDGPDASDAAQRIRETRTLRMLGAAIFLISVYGWFWIQTVEEYARSVGMLAP